jgi:hypothetical protein
LLQAYWPILAPIVKKLGVDVTAEAKTLVVADEFFDAVYEGAIDVACDE